MSKLKVPDAVMKKLADVKEGLESLFPAAELNGALAMASGGNCKGCSGTCRGTCRGNCDGTCIIQ